MQVIRTLTGITTRRVEPEIMDQPELDSRRHWQALKGLSRINLWSASAAALWTGLRDLIRRHGLGGLRVLDVATGGGDVPIRLWRKARHEGIPLRIDGCDMSRRAVEYARERARRERADVAFFPLNVLDEPIPREYDVIVNTLFLHHLSNERACEFLRRLAFAAKRAILVDDLQRGAAGLGIAFLGTQFLSRSTVVHSDGLRSVAAAFTMDEAAALAASAGLADATIRGHWPFRYLLSWRRE